LSRHRDRNFVACAESLDLEIIEFHFHVWAVQLAVGPLRFRMGVADIPITQQ